MYILILFVFPRTSFFSSSSHEWRRRALNTGVTFFSGVEADRKKKKKREDEGKMRMWRREPERRSTGIEIPEKEFLAIPAARRSVDSCRFIPPPPSRSRLPPPPLLPLSVSPHFSNPISVWQEDQPPRFFTISFFRISVSAERRMAANGQSVGTRFLAVRINLLHATENLAFGDFSSAKKFATAVHLS